MRIESILGVVEGRCKLRPGNVLIVGKNPKKYSRKWKFWSKYCNYTRQRKASFSSFIALEMGVDVFKLIKREGFKE